MQWEVTPSRAKCLGRTARVDGALWLSYSASGAEWTFFGTKCTVELAGDAMSGDPVHAPRYAVEADGRRAAEGTVGRDGRAVVTVECPDAGMHVVRVLKLSESADSTMGIVAISCEEEPAATPDLPLYIEFIGDSITCGYGVDGVLGELYRTANEDATKGYAYLTAKALGADYSLVSMSGYGIISGYTETGVIRPACTVPPLYTTMGDSYGAFAGKLLPRETGWDFSRQPDIIVINLGTNDASYCGDNPERRREYIDAYRAFLAEVRSHNAKAEIVCILGTMDQRLCESVKTAVSEYSEQSGDGRAAYFGMPLQDMERDGAAVDWHPSAVSHGKAAAVLTEYLRTITA